MDQHRTCSQEHEPIAKRQRPLKDPPERAPPVEAGQLVELGVNAEAESGPRPGGCDQPEEAVRPRRGRDDQVGSESLHPPPKRSRLGKEEPLGRVPRQGDAPRESQGIASVRRRDHHDLADDLPEVLDQIVVVRAHSVTAGNRVREDGYAKLRQGFAAAQLDLPRGAAGAGLHPRPRSPRHPDGPVGELERAAGPAASSSNLNRSVKAANRTSRSLLESPRSCSA